VFELSDSESYALISCIIDRYGDGLSQQDFIDCVLLLFEDIAGLEHFAAQCNQSTLNYLWRLYCEQRST